MSGYLREPWSGKKQEEDLKVDHVKIQIRTSKEEREDRTR